jgi:hypothetical protein
MSTVQVDAINESTTNAGVTVDGVLIKDGNVDGVDVSAIVSGRLVKLTSATASSSAELLFDNFVDLSTYPSYYLVFRQIKVSSDNTELRFKFRTGGSSGSDLTGVYPQGGVYWHGDATGGAIFENATQTDYSTMENALGNADAEAMVANGYLYPATGTASTTNVNIFNYKIHKQMYNDTVRTIERTTFHESTTTVTGIKFFMSVGNIASGTIDIYGVKS